MRTPIAPVALVALVFSACIDGAPTAPATSVIRASSGSGTLQTSSASRPFKGSCTTTFSPPPFPLPPTLHQIDIGNCNLTHLGASVFYGELDINFAAGTQSGWRRLTSANGDVVYVTTTGTSRMSAPGQVAFTAQLTIVGGTGRFAEATGSAVGTGVANIATRSTSLTIDGSIRY